MSPARPKFSIIIPAYNEAALLPTCLQSIEEQTYRGHYEVVVVDNASIDRTAALATAYGARVVVEPKRGIVYARRAGFAAATGQILVSTDADTVVPPNWLEEFDRVLKDKRFAGVIGGIELSQADSVKKRLIRFVAPIYTGLNYLAGGHFSATNFAIRREVYKQVGGFDTRYQIAEDVDLSRRVKAAGFRLKRLLSLKVKTSSRRFDVDLWGQLGSYFAAVLSALIYRRPSRRVLDPIRQKAFDLNRRIIQHPMLIALTILVIGLIVYLSFDPTFSIYSHARVKTNRKVIALTFDDGPSEPYTDQVLDILKANDVHATFFEVGQNVRRYPDTSRRVVAEGNIIANHSDGHAISLMTRSPATIEANVDRANDTIDETTGKRPVFFRPPYGFRTFWGAGRLSRAGYEIVTWDDMTFDYWGLPPARVAQNIIANARPGGIIVLHDGQEAKLTTQRENVVASLPLIIEGLKRQGYEFVTLDQLFGVAPYR